MFFLAHLRHAQHALDDIVGRDDERHRAVVPGPGLRAGGGSRQREEDEMEESQEGKIPARAPVAQWIEQPPPKGQVARSIRVWGAKYSG